MIRVDIETIIMASGAVPSLIVLRERQANHASDAPLRALSIQTGSFEAASISRGIDGTKHTRPITHDLFIDTLRKLGARVERVEINRVDAPVFYSNIIIARDGEDAGEVSIDARPSDALALAVRSNAPIYVEDDVMNRAGTISYHADKDAGDEEFKQFVEGLPEVKQAKEAQAAAETAARQAREQQAKLKVEEQLKEISALDPTIKELKDLAKMETYPKFYELVKRGNSLTDAFKLANYDALTGRAAAASRQAAINSAQGKQHLSPTTQRGAGAVSVPADVKAEYLAFNPDATDAEIQQHYNRYVKNHKK